MIKTLDDSYGKNLWEMYLESVRPERDEPFPLPEIPPLPLETASADPLQFSPDRIFGSVRMLDDGEFLILFMVIAQTDTDTYKAIKVSNFTQFGTYFDLEFMSANGSYIAELDNAFNLSTEQVRNSVVLDETDAYTFIQLESAWSAEGNQFSGKPLYWESIGRWRAQFRIKEHEITCAYRVPRPGTAAASLWIPQLEIREAQMSQVAFRDHFSDEIEPSAHQESLYDSYSVKSKESKRMSRSERGPCASVMYERLYRQITTETRWYRLVPGRVSPWEIELEKSLWGTRARIYNGEYLIFKGVLPRYLDLSRYDTLSKGQIEAALNLRLET